MEVDVGGRIIRDAVPVISPLPGQNIYTTLDTRLQQAAESILLGEIEGWNAYLGELRITSGVVIAINPQTGEILAMVSYPTYENNRMARVIPAYYYEQLYADVRNPLLNQAVGAELPAGSKSSTSITPLSTKSIASRHTAAEIRLATFPGTCLLIVTGMRPNALSHPFSNSTRVVSVYGLGANSTNGINSTGQIGWATRHRSWRWQRPAMSFAAKVADELLTILALLATDSMPSNTFCFTRTSSRTASIIQDASPQA